ncbi:MAG: hypothetical protein ACI4OB_06920 [Christensenellales bacterium]
MNLKELSKLYYLDKLIKRDEARLKTLYEQREGSAVRYSDMPRDPNVKKPVERIVVEIDSVERRLMKNVEQWNRVTMELEEAIEKVDDPLVQLIMYNRFVDLKSWEEVADAVGGNNTSESVKKMCYRFIKHFQ